MKVLHTIRNRWKEMEKAQQGLAIIEFALSISFLLLLFFGAVEVPRFLLIVQKMELTVHTVADSITQTGAPNTTQLDPQSNTEFCTEWDALMTGVSGMMSPYTMGSNGTIIVTDLTYTTAGGMKKNWQNTGGGTLAASSKVSVSAGAKPLPDNLPAFSMLDGDSVVIGEIYYNYSPLVTQTIFPSTTLYRAVVYVPRYSSQTLASFTTSCT